MTLTTNVNPRLIKTVTTTVMGDTLTPVAVFLKLRDKYKSVLLLEANDFTNIENSKSYIAVDIVDELIVTKGYMSLYQEGQCISKEPILNKSEVVNGLQSFVDSHNCSDKTSFNGCFGHTNFEAVKYFEDLEFDEKKDGADIPAIRYATFKYIIEFDHFKDTITITENILDNKEPTLDDIVSQINLPIFETFGFELVGDTTSNMTDEEFKNMVRTGKNHCQQGNVFQIVFSRRFNQKFQGDDFNVYRVLRSLNPSPYLFYFDFGAYRLFGSSPESQLIIADGVASVNPIAGTFKRSGKNKQEDAKKALELSADPKENAEHIMLVDLARNDLSRHCSNVRISKLKEVHFFSHVIHLVSKVEGDLKEKNRSITVFGDTFPAGTLSGAPKHRAMQIINEVEPTSRSFYGGAIGFIDFNGNMNQAILIRSFLSLDNELHFQAGAGIVIDSEEEKELQEINNKLGALHAAIKKATSI